MSAAHRFSGARSNPGVHHRPAIQRGDSDRFLVHILSSLARGTNEQLARTITSLGR